MYTEYCQYQLLSGYFFVCRWLGSDYCMHIIPSEVECVLIYKGIYYIPRERTCTINARYFSVLVFVIGYYLTFSFSMFHIVVYHTIHIF